MEKVQPVNAWMVPVFATLIIGMSGWLVSKTSSNGEQLAALTVQIHADAVARSQMDVENGNAHKQFFDKIDGLVSKREFETRLLSIEAKISECNIAIKAIEVRLQNIEMQLPKTPRMGGIDNIPYYFGGSNSIIYNNLLSNLPVDLTYK